MDESGANVGNDVTYADVGTSTEIKEELPKIDKTMFEVGKVMASAAVKTLCDLFDRIPIQSGQESEGLLDLIIETQRILDWGIYPYESVIMAMVGRTSEPLTSEVLGAMSIFDEWKDVKSLLINKMMPATVRNRLRYERLYRRQKDDEKLESYAKNIINVAKVILPSMEESKICDLIITNCNPEVKYKLFMTSQPETFKDLWTVITGYQEFESEVMKSGSSRSSGHCCREGDKCMKQDGAVKKRETVCYRCGGIGHEQRVCPSKPTANYAGRRPIHRSQVVVAPRNNYDTVQLTCWINDMRYSAVFDSGSSLSLIKRQTYEKLKQKPELNEVSPSFKGIVVGGTTFTIDSCTNIDLRFGYLTIKQCMYLVEGIETDILLGADFIREHCDTTSWKDMKLYLNKGNRWVKLHWI